MTIYEPQEDSFLLETQVKKCALGRVLDLGTGSGIQALAAAQNKMVREVIAVDINPKAVKRLQEKVSKNKLRKIKVMLSDLFSEVNGKFDTIIFNPPYLPEAEGEDKESQQITTGGKQGYEIIERFLKEAKRHLHPKGSILLVYSSLTGNVEKVAKKYGFKVEVLEKRQVFFETLIVGKCTLEN